MESGAEVAIIGTSDKVYQVADEFKACLLYTSH